MLRQEADMEHAQRRGLARLMLRWPERRAELRRKARNDAHLLALCEAYEAAWGAAEYWAKEQPPVGPLRAAEYRDLASATEEDILTRIS
jgi:hypothetical protein